MRVRAASSSSPPHALARTAKGSGRVVDGHRAPERSTGRLLVGQAGLHALFDQTMPVTPVGAGGSAGPAAPMVGLVGLAGRRARS